LCARIEVRVFVLMYLRFSLWALTGATVLCNCLKSVDEG